MRLLLVFLVLASLLTVPFLLWGEGFEERFSREGAVRWLSEHGEWAWAAGIGLLVADLVLPIPATAVIAALGYLHGTLAGGLIGAAGSFLSGALAYGLCRLMGRPAALWIAGPRDLERGEDLLASVGGWAIAISRWMPLLPEVLASLAGMVRMPAPVFFLALACGSVPMAFTFAAVGASGIDRPALAIVLSAVLPIALWPLARRLPRSRAG